ncbi:hypothetical protein [Bacillus paralicheniformis]|uniref:hypothetical protein n=1 Tax=Bacillus paralicheniformis TaxID=1648923 RepID=UPI001E3E7E02|nr:hypothetical protein [Bacillus paralicheniformis]
MDYSKVEKFIKENDSKDHATITGGVSEEKVKFIENELNVNLFRRETINCESPFYLNVS